MSVSTWMLFVFIFFASMFNCQSQSNEDYQDRTLEKLHCTPICEDDSSLKGETFHCLISAEGRHYKFIARNPNEEKWRFYGTNFDADSNILCQIGRKGDLFAGSKSKRKCSAYRKLKRSPSSQGQSNMAVSVSGPGSFAMASDGRESLFANGDKGPSAQTTGNAHAFSSDGSTNAESHFGNNFMYPVNGRPIFSGVGLRNPFIMGGDQMPTYRGDRNLGIKQNPRFYQTGNVPHEYPAVYSSYVPYMSPLIPPYEVKEPRYRPCHPRCRREAIDNYSDEDNFSNSNTEFVNEICQKTEEDVCRRKKIVFCGENEDCCWKEVDSYRCNKKQNQFPNDCRTRLSAIFGLITI